MPHVFYRKIIQKVIYLDIRVSGGQEMTTKRARPKVEKNGQEMLLGAVRQGKNSHFPPLGQARGRQPNAPYLTRNSRGLGKELPV